MNLSKYLYLTLFLFANLFNLNGFQQKIPVTAVYQEILDGKTDFNFKEVEFVNDIEEYLDENDPDSLYVFNALERVMGIDDLHDQLSELQLGSIEISNSTGELYLIDLFLDTLMVSDSEMELLDIELSEIGTIYLERNSITELQISDSYIEVFETEDMRFRSAVYEYNIFDEQFDEFQFKVDESYQMTGNDFYDGAVVDIAEAHSNAFMIIEDNIFSSRKSKRYVTFEGDSMLFRTQFLISNSGDLSELYVTDNQFLNDGDNEMVALEGNMNELSIHGNTFESNLVLEGSVKNFLAIHSNEINGKVSLSDLNIKETGRMEIDLETLLDKRIGIHQYQPGYGDAAFESDEMMEFVSQVGGNYYLFFNEDDDELSQIEFNTLISDYYRIHAFYKDNGFHEYADQVYLRMKDVELSKLRAEWQELGGLERLIKWQLNSILKFYTKYGTSPTRAIIISFYVLLAFTLFYFFFPSEWDTRSKAQILIDFRHLREKNDKGYFKPFLVLSYDLGRSFVNAFSLSLNAFITLGFGAIPTTGIARYVCIFQGFLGWFLLSIFTASLISQILY